jgi:pimeloyl-ACP methyl ester carboxylesterase
MADEQKSAETIELIKHCSQTDLTGVSRYIFELEKCPPISVYLQGDLEKQRNGPVIMTIHDVGSSYRSMVDFVNHPDMAEVKERCMFLHVSMFGQSAEAEELAASFPSLLDTGMSLVTVLDELRIKSMVLLGDGAGAYTALRFGLCHPTRTEGVIMINGSASAPSTSYLESILETIGLVDGNNVVPGEGQLNKQNLRKYSAVFTQRTSMLEELADRVSFDLLLLSGALCGHLADADEIIARVKPGLASFIKVDDVTEPLKEAQEKVSDALILFCQGLGLMATARRKVSKTGSIGSNEGSTDPRHMTRRISMEMFDQPNMRRFSVTQ